MGALIAVPGSMAAPGIDWGKLVLKAANELH